MRPYTLTPFLILICITFCKAHGDLDLRIKAITVAIAMYPDSSALYFNRGKLRFQHEEYQSSIDDIIHSIQNDFQNDFQYIYIAKSYYKLEQYKKAQNNLTLYLDQNPENVVGLNLKGRILFAQKKYKESALCFEKVIDLTIRTLPENYLEAAHSWEASSVSNKAEKSIKVLELGLKNLGPIITIQNELIATHLDNDNRDKAIKLQLNIIEKTKRKESAYFKLSEIYRRLEEPKNAIEAAKNAKKHWEKLPNRIRKNAAMKSLINEIKQILTKTQ